MYLFLMLLFALFILFILHLHPRSSIFNLQSSSSFSSAPFLFFLIFFEQSQEAIVEAISTDAHNYMIWVPSASAHYIYLSINKARQNCFDGQMIQKIAVFEKLSLIYIPLNQKQSNTYMYIQRHVYTYIHTYLRTYAHTHIYVPAYIYTYVHAYTHMYIHT